MGVGWIPGGRGRGLPSGGLPGQVLTLDSDGNPVWANSALSGNTLGWGFQDFPAGSGPVLTITANQNGTIVFDSSKIVSHTAEIVRTLSPDTFAYSGSFKLFSSRIVVVSHAGTSVVLNAAANSSWGGLRVYYLYNYGPSLPDNYELAPEFINAIAVSEIKELMVSGPATGVSTNNAIARWDGTGGDIIKDSGVLVDDNRYVDGAGFLNDDNLASGIALQISPTKQMIVVSDYTLSGEVDIQGTLAVL